MSLLNTEITALAREYGEHEAKTYSTDSDTKRELYKKVCTNVAESVLEFLSQHYYLVEKEKLDNIYQGILVQLDPKNFGYSPYNQGRMDVIKSLFPEIAKEVQS